MPKPSGFLRQLKHFFPVPKYLTPDVTGIDISDESIKVVRLNRQNDKLILDKFGEEKIPMGVLSGGKIDKPDILIKSLETIRRKFDIKYAIVALPEEQAYTVKMRVPPVHKKDLRTSVELQIEELVPLKVDEMEFDYEILRAPTRGSMHYDLMVSAIPRSVVDSYYDAFESALITPLAFEIEGAALTRAVIPAKENDTFIIADLGKRRTGIAISTERVLRFSATVPFGGVHFNKAIMDKFGVSEVEAEQMKRDPTKVSEGRLQEFNELVLSLLAVIGDEINKYKLYWHEHKDEAGDDRPRIAGVYICGGGSNMKEICEKLSPILSLPVTMANPWVNVFDPSVHTPGLSAEDVLRYATALGLALRNTEVERHTEYKEKEQ
ncbi:MAG: type IV pilus assembly protein PilM [Candidatus Vogelbacteria bacterium]|nr:type IV pilus assembly protein PilM [Candidatus Vogelbacteria bacterium]